MAEIGNVASPAEKPVLPSVQAVTEQFNSGIYVKKSVSVHIHHFYPHVRILNLSSIALNNQNLSTKNVQQLMNA